MFLCQSFAFGGHYDSGNKLRITIDGVVWRLYTGEAQFVGASGWNIVDMTDDNNIGIISLMPFKKFSSNLKVEFLIITRLPRAKSE